MSLVVIGSMLLRNGSGKRRYAARREAGLAPIAGAGVASPGLDPIRHPGLVPGSTRRQAHRQEPCATACAGEWIRARGRSDGRFGAAAARGWRPIALGLVAALALAACGGEAPVPAPSSSPAVAGTAPVPRPAGRERVVLAFGDSLYAGYGLGRGESLPAQIEARLRRAGINATVVNAGVSGDTSAAGRQRLGFVLDNMASRPELVLLGLGGNDLLRQLPAAETRANMAAMLGELDRRGLPVVLTGMRAPPNLGRDYVRGFDAIWPDLARRHHGLLYPFILDGVVGDPALMQPDRVHPNAVGTRRIADRVAPLVARGLAD